MTLVDYSDSDDDAKPDVSPPLKKRKVSTSADGGDALPPLPQAFRDLYSSTVRTSTQDDPSLHAGRKRVTPHVVGNWPTHVYLEWNPSIDEAKILRHVVEATIKSASTARGQGIVHSLLQNDLNVGLPLHVSLSRPLALRTAEKDIFLDRLGSRIHKSQVRAFTVQPTSVIWHPNEDATRWFLVLRLRRPTGDELRNLLAVSNHLAKEMQQPQLYQKPPTALNTDRYSILPGESNDSFHISLAWSLKSQANDELARSSLIETHLPALQELRIRFSEVKIRIGQDVASVSLSAQRVKEKSEE